MYKTNLIKDIEKLQFRNIELANNLQEQIQKTIEHSQKINIIIKDFDKIINENDLKTMNIDEKIKLLILLDKIVTNQEKYMIRIIPKLGQFLKVILSIINDLERNHNSNNSKINNSERPISKRKLKKYLDNYF